MIRRLAALLLLGFWSWELAAREPPELRNAAQVRQLTAEQAERRLPVRLNGVLTFFDQTQFFHFIQDETAGVYFSLDEATNRPPLKAGLRVELTGTTRKGEFAPIVAVRQIRTVGPGQFPRANQVNFEQLASGQEDSQFVEVTGIVRAAQFEERSRYYQVEIATGGGRLTALASSSPATNAASLVDSTVRVQGACVTRFNRQRQLFDIRLLVPRPEDLRVEEAGPSEPFGIAAQSLGSLLQFTPRGPYGHRVKVVGTVTYRPNDSGLYLEDQGEGLYVETRQAGRLHPGDRVEALGFPARGEYTPMLQDAVYRRSGGGPEPDADSITADQALRGTHDCRLVRIEAMVLDRAQHSREQFLVLQSGGFIFHAYLQGGAAGDFQGLENGCKVAVTGICRIETGSEWHVGEDWRASSFRLLLRSPADVQVLKARPWWTLTRLLWTVAVLGIIVLAAFAWVGILRRRVQQQTEIIRQKLQLEAALKERYADLLENANDIVYTHDLEGRLTSINQAGERLLQRSRDAILWRNLLDLVVPEQQAAAQQWLDQVLHDAAPPTAEWDFATAAGPLKLEISTRLIHQHGQQAEVEGIARDITERKRLERELLEISSREQRRIGHDLHDGVCQQLVGICYLTETLADRLQEKGVPESAEAERISRLLNTALTQTRGVARGLFPVRLEENGLISALEELAANANALFQMDCRFVGQNAPEKLDNGIALHLYYIAQEAVANAAKHGKAKNVRIQLGPFQDRFALTIQDDGQGFCPPGARPAGMGLRIMNYRARVIDASLEIKSQPGGGTSVTCRFAPVFREPADARKN